MEHAIAVQLSRLIAPPSTAQRQGYNVEIFAFSSPAPR